MRARGRRKVMGVTAGLATLAAVSAGGIGVLARSETVAKRTDASASMAPHSQSTTDDDDSTLEPSATPSASPSSAATPAPSAALSAAPSTSASSTGTQTTTSGTPGSSSGTTGSTATTPTTVNPPAQGAGGPPHATSGGS